MPAYNNSHLYGGAYYKGNSINAKFPFSRTLFNHKTIVMINYVSLDTGDTLDQDVLLFEYNKNDDLSIFKLPFIDNASNNLQTHPERFINLKKIGNTFGQLKASETNFGQLLSRIIHRDLSNFDNYTDQYIAAADNGPLGITNLDPDNNRLEIDYTISPIRQNGIIHLNFTYNNRIIKQKSITAPIGASLSDQNIIQYVPNTYAINKIDTSPKFTYAEQSVFVPVDRTYGEVEIIYRDQSSDELLDKRIIAGKIGSPFDTDTYLNNLPDLKWSDGNTKDTISKFTNDIQVMTITVNQNLPKPTQYGTIEVIYEDMSGNQIYSRHDIQPIGTQFNLTYYDQDIPTDYDFVRNITTNVKKFTDNPQIVLICLRKE